MSQQDQVRVRHLLNRFGLGASQEDLAHYGQGTWREAVEKLIDEDRPEAEVRIAESFFDARNPGLQRMSQLQGHWYRRLLTTKRPLQHRMLLFWHDHFATSAAKVRLAQVMLGHMDALYENSLAPFRSLLGAVCKDPAMVIWLDLQDNTKDTPNENFAREVMELFTLGVNNGYTEMDIQEAARAFTGWTYSMRRGGRNRGTAFALDSRVHDAGEKTVLGKSGELDGDDVLDILCDHPNTARYISHKAWEWFAYKDPQNDTIDRVERAFRESGLQTKELIRAIMTDEEFYSERAMRTRVKSPVDFCVGTARAIGVQRLERADAARPLAFGSLMKVATRDMGMELLAPPDVDGWPSGTGWISSATMSKRIGWARLLFLGEQQSMTRNRRQAPPFTAREFFAAQTPAELGMELVKVFDAVLSPAQIQVVVSAAERAAQGSLTVGNFNEVAAEAATVVFGAPEFQMH
ncbi:MAG: DUF1800 family protein [Fimbriimonadaceae bacterium]